MALFSKLKQAVNSVTGGGAKVFLTITTQPSRQQPFHIQAKAVIGDAALNCSSVYIEVQSVEKVVVRNANVGGTTQTVSGNETIFSQKFNISGQQTLEGKQEYTWEGDIQLPPTVLPTYRGRNAQHEWQIKAALDVPGNDPNSEWVNIEIA